MPLVAGHKGIDVRQTGNRLLFDSFLQDMSGVLVTTGTAKLYLYELQDDGSLNSYDFSSNTFKTTALTNAFASLTHRQGNNNTTNTGIWTSGLTVLTGFSNSGIYYARTNHTNAWPNDQTRKFQFGSAEGDLTVSLASGIRADVREWLTSNVAATTAGIPDINVKNYNNQTAQTDASGLPKVDTVFLNQSGISPAIPQIGVNVVRYNDKLAQTDANNLPKVDVEDWLANPVAASAAGIPNVNVAYWNAFVAQTDTNNFPIVDTSYWNSKPVSNNADGIPVVDVAYWLGFGVNGTVDGYPNVNLTYCLDNLQSRSLDNIYDELANGTYGLSALNGTLGVISSVASNGLTQTILAQSYIRSISGVIPTAAAIRQEIDLNSLKLISISGRLPAALNASGAILADVRFLNSSGVKQREGNIGIDWGNVLNPDATVNLSATTTNLVNTLTTYTGNTLQTGDSYSIVNNGLYGNSSLYNRLFAISGYIDTEVAAIKAKTDNLPSDPADASDIAALFATMVTTSGIRFEMDLNSTKLASIPTISGIRFDLDSNSTKLSTISIDTANIKTRIPEALSSSGAMLVDVRFLGGSGIRQREGFVGIDWGNILNPTATQLLTNTSISGTTISSGGATASQVRAEMDSNSVMFRSISGYIDTEIGTIQGGIVDIQGRLPAVLDGNGAMIVDVSYWNGSVVNNSVQEVYDIVNDSTYGVIATGFRADGIWTDTAIIKAKTNNLPSDPASTTNVTNAQNNINSWLRSISGTLVTISGIRSDLDNNSVRLSSIPTVSGIRFELDQNSLKLSSISGRIPAALSPSGAMLSDVRYLDASGIKQSQGYMGIDWAQVLNSSTNINLSGTTVKAVTNRVSSNAGVIKNTACNNFEFLLVSSTDHQTAVTSATVTAIRSIDGGAFASCDNSVSEVGNGIYKINLSAADLNGDVVTFVFSALGADDRRISIVTTE